MEFETFTANDLIVKACLYDFIIIGEASVNIPLDLQARHPAIPWRLMSDMRNILAHEYFRVDLQLTWATIQTYLPPLVPQLQALLEQEAADL